jgi:hypothetical protein
MVHKAMQTDGAAIPATLAHDARIDELVAARDAAARVHEDATVAEVTARLALIDADVALKSYLQSLTQDSRAAYLRAYPCNRKDQSAQTDRPDLPCCQWAQVRFCTCTRSWECPKHGTRCFGSHE